MIIQTKKADVNHTQKSNNNREQRQKIYNSTRWQKLRAEKLMQQPVCEICNENLAEHVHHKDSFMNYVQDLRVNVAFDSNNLQSVCAQCHSKLHNL
jgi:5-methylcytosine-specific restriction protein A